MKPAADRTRGTSLKQGSTGAQQKTPFPKRRAAGACSSAALRRLLPPGVCGCFGVFSRCKKETPMKLLTWWILFSMMLSGCDDKPSGKPSCRRRRGHPPCHEDAQAGGAACRAGRSSLSVLIRKQDGVPCLRTGMPRLGSDLYIYDFDTEVVTPISSRIHGGMPDMRIFSDIRHYIHGLPGSVLWTGYSRKF